ncbi:hypothetical protein E4U44_006693 [Claviceps purpurea]|nr:hypothetical protein E4U44_006693 [Claviceps purpurea]
MRREERTDGMGVVSYSIIGACSVSSQHHADDHPMLISARCEDATDDEWSGVLEWLSTIGGTRRIGVKMM